jgi:hypothetical protein
MALTAATARTNNKHQQHCGAAHAESKQVFDTVTEIG